MYYTYEVWYNGEYLYNANERFSSLDECNEKFISIWESNPSRYDRLDITYVRVDDDGSITEVNPDLSIPERYQKMLDSNDTHDLDSLLDILDEEPDDIDWDTNVELYSMTYRKIYRKQED